MKSFLLASLIAFNVAPAMATNEVTIYSVYDSKRLDVIFKPFVEKTGIKVNIIDGTSDGLIERLATEGSATTADLHIDKDLVYNTRASALGLYRPYNSIALSNNISTNLADADKNWLTFVYRARVVLFNKNKVNPAEITDYADLANAKWANKLCLRTSTNSYNQALGAFMVKHYGEEKALEIFKGWVNNFSVEPLKSDRDVINAVATGACDIGVANTYYLAPIVEKDPSFPVGIIFPNQATTGSHVNGVGIGIVKYAKNVTAATMVIEYLTSKETQAPLAAAFDQYPANKNAPMSEILRSFGAFKEDQSNVKEIGKFVESANTLMKKASYK